MKSANGYVVQWEWLASFVWSISTTNDAMITVTLVVLLRDQRTNVHRRYDFCVASFRASLMSCRTAALVDKLILWSIGLSRHLYLVHLISYFLTETGMLTRLVCGPFSMLQLVSKLSQCN
jgi:hypothetical protein